MGRLARYPGIMRTPYPTDAALRGTQSVSAEGVAVGSVRVLLTAAEAYPALEEQFLRARTEISASFLVFDLRTKLRSDGGLGIGSTWFDLVVHTLRRGVSIRIVLSDVDPIARAAMHRDATRNQRLFLAAAEAAGQGAKLTVIRALHPAQTGALVRLAIWPYILRKVATTAGWLNRLAPAERSAALRDMPDLASKLTLRRDGTVRPRWLQLPSLHPCTHHQKLAVFDRQRLYIGGLDLDERRYDTPNHRRPGHETWHDVQLLVTGKVALEAHRHLETFLDVVEGRVAPPPMPSFLRTLSRGRSGGLAAFGPTPLVADLAQAHFTLIRRAGRLIYLESQYFRDRHLAHALASRARANPDVGLILILPAAPDEVAFAGKRGLDARFGEAMQAHCLRVLRRAYRSRLFVGSPALARVALPDGRATHEARDRLRGAPIIYVHAKVSVFDDRAAIVSSANLNGRSLTWDTEAGVLLKKRGDVVDLRQRLMAHWLPKAAARSAFALDTAVDEWRRIAQGNARLRPDQRQGFLLPHDFAAAEAFGRTLPIIPEEMV